VSIKSSVNGFHFVVLSAAGASISDRSVQQLEVACGSEVLAWTPPYFVIPQHFVACLVKLVQHRHPHLGEVRILFTKELLSLMVILLLDKPEHLVNHFLPLFPFLCKPAVNLDLVVVLSELVLIRNL
jgi:hypothetical protein